MFEVRKCSKDNKKTRETRDHRNRTSSGLVRSGLEASVAEYPGQCAREIEGSHLYGIVSLLAVMQLKGIVGRREQKQNLD